MKKMKDVKTLTTLAMLLAIATVLGFLKIPVNNFIEFRFGFLPLACSSMLYGPVIGGITGLAADFLGYIAKPTGPYFPGFALSNIISGVIYGILLYKKPVTVKRVVMTEILETIVISMLMNSLWLSILYGNGFWPVFTARVVKSIVMIPINSFLLYTVLKASVRIGVSTERKATEK